MVDNDRRAAKALVDALSDSRHNPTYLLSMVNEYADSDDTIQANLWSFVVSYLYDRQTMFDWSGGRTPVQQYVGERCSHMIHQYLDIEYRQASSPAKGITFEIVTATDRDEDWHH
jgi:hypothetical protein